MRIRLHVDELLTAVARVGLQVERLQSTTNANLYAWVTPEGDLVYIGKAASPQRIHNEAQWTQGLPTSFAQEIPLVAILRRHDAWCAPLKFDPSKVNLSPGLEYAESTYWKGSPELRQAVQYFMENPPSVADAERILIRTAVRFGALIANSQFSGVWESKGFAPHDALAFLAFDMDPQVHEFLASEDPLKIYGGGVNG